MRHILHPWLGPIKDLANKINSIRRLKLRCCYVLRKMGTSGKLPLGENVGVRYLKLQSAMMVCIAKSKKVI